MATDTLRSLSEAMDLSSGTTYKFCLAVDRVLDGLAAGTLVYERGDGDFIIEAFIRSLRRRQQRKEKAYSQFEKLVWKSFGTARIFSSSGYAKLLASVIKHVLSMREHQRWHLHFLIGLLQNAGQLDLKLEPYKEEIMHLVRHSEDLSQKDVLNPGAPDSSLNQLFALLRTVAINCSSFVAQLWPTYLGTGGIAHRILTQGMLEGIYDIAAFKAETLEGPRTSEPYRVLISALRSLSLFLRNTRSFTSLAERPSNRTMTYIPYGYLVGEALIEMHSLLERLFLACAEELVDLREAIYKALEALWLSITPSRVCLDLPGYVDRTSFREVSRMSTYSLKAMTTVLLSIKKEVSCRGFNCNKSGPTLASMVQEYIDPFVSSCSQVVERFSSDPESVERYIPFLAAFFGLYPTCGHIAEILASFPQMDRYRGRDGERILPLEALRLLGLIGVEAPTLQHCYISSRFAAALAPDVLFILGVTSFHGHLDEPGTIDPMGGLVRTHSFFRGQVGTKRTRPQDAVRVQEYTGTRGVDESAGYQFLKLLVLRDIEGCEGLRMGVSNTMLNGSIDEIVADYVFNLIMQTIALLSQQEFTMSVQLVDFFCLIGRLPLLYFEGLMVSEMYVLTDFLLGYAEHLVPRDLGEELLPHVIGALCHMLESSIVGEELGEPFDLRAANVILQLLRNPALSRSNCKAVIGIVGLLNRGSEALTETCASLVKSALELCRRQNRLQGYITRVLTCLFEKLTPEALVGAPWYGTTFQTVLTETMNGLSARDRIAFNSLCSCEVVLNRLDVLVKEDASLDMASLIVAKRIFLTLAGAYLNRLTGVNAGLVVQTLRVLLAGIPLLVLKPIEAFTLQSFFLVVEKASGVMQQLQQYQTTARGLLRKAVVLLVTHFLKHDEVNPDKEIFQVLQEHGQLVYDIVRTDQQALENKVHSLRTRQASAPNREEDPAMFDPDIKRIETRLHTCKRITKRLQSLLLSNGGDDKDEVEIDDPPRIREE
ncbi:hypothetical protein GMRT_14934 [Giardia muris]|uniref:Uncharacterized protein n=1 Tax=Giardia muris TaxID=5742 RepID=A0A4Z1SPH2_GIAMU|nr:hypothetical protein GMRT_14934 [Giardia muris]|eukprot:TNJ27724.1 hypothetical protein GMRT_14934 [Giardia muris]